ncbi:hypothetical protein [Seonamhaeicola sp. ML3]|uniref:hypothetical protein n=1 Tax=Seonamhaeicola sp. ML3 TaxID=2937786 RepID=UPI00200EA339|nr:hypothetical protein [Seonamhaeicola sp. ML3]
MKRKKIIIIAFVLLVLITIIMLIIPNLYKSRSAPTTTESAEESIERELVYICLTDCIPGKKYNQEGNCPNCNLPLEILNTRDVNDNLTNSDFIKENTDSERTTKTTNK